MVRYTVAASLGSHRVAVRGYWSIQRVSHDIGRVVAVGVAVAVAVTVTVTVAGAAMCCSWLQMLSC